MLALLRGDADARRGAVRSLLPALLHAAAALGGALHRLAVRAVWAQCRCAPCPRRVRSSCSLGALRHELPQGDCGG